MEFKTMLMAKKVLWDKDSLSDTYGKFFAEPFERGYGITLGNSIRRVLLSSIQGAAPISVRISGVKHEFSSIKGVREDVPDIILNIKSLNFKLTRIPITVITLDVTGPQEVTGKDFKLNSHVELVNQEQHIAELAQRIRLQMELRVAMGRGYVPAPDIKKQEEETLDIEDKIGLIYLDAAFSPIKNVKYYVEPARVGDRTDYDRLVMEVTTNGTVKPQEAVSYAARIIQDHLHLFTTIEEEVKFLEETEEAGEEVSPIAEIEEKLDKSIEELELSVRSFNCLQAAGIKTIRDLVQKTEQEMLKYRNFGRKSLQEIKNILKDMGLHFNTQLDDRGLPVELAESQVTEE